MDANQTIDLEALLSPISEETPAGTDPRGSGEWSELKQARQTHGENDPFGESEVEPADWGRVIELGTQMLREQGKHLEVACDLTEALVREHGFAGLRDGLRLIREMQEKYWDDLYPALDTEDDMALEESLLDRAGPLNGLSTNIVAAINDTPVTAVSGADNFSWLLYNDSRYVDNVGRKDPEAKAKLIADGRPDPDAVNVAVSGTSWQFYKNGLEALEQAAEELKQLDDLLDEKYASLREEGPSLQGIKEVVTDATGFFDRTYRDKRPPEEEAAEEGAGTEAAEATPVTGGSLPLEPRDRADAIRRLHAVAAFFQRTEPHSPVAYLVQRAAGWGEITLVDWLAEVIKDESTLNNIRETLGVKKAEDGGSSW